MRISDWSSDVCSSDLLVNVSDRLHAFLADRFGKAARMRAWPVHAEDGLQVISGRLDLLIDLGDGFAIVDHKRFPGYVEKDDDRLGAFAGQVGTYARAIETSTEQPCRGVWRLVKGR